MERVDPALGRSRGGLTTKIHLVCDINGVPLSFLLSPGQHTDSRYLVPVMEQIRLPGRKGPSP
ncbi:transposase [Halomonas eurihalina]|uniref:Transposase n=1 Tax=Halomonas eurihalina TaxID=42566 RepID=A0A5D9DC95_HALER|nr:transposase [Halomonas eurihalina]